MSETGKKMYRQADVDAARTNEKMQKNCAKGVQELFEDCPFGETIHVMTNGTPNCGMHGADPRRVSRIPADWPPEDQILRDEPQPEPAAFEGFCVVCGDKQDCSRLFDLWREAAAHTKLAAGYAVARPYVVVTAECFSANHDREAFTESPYPEIIYPEAIARLQAAIDAQRSDELVWPEWAVWICVRSDNKVCTLSDTEPISVSGGWRLSKSVKYAIVSAELIKNRPAPGTWRRINKGAR
jgi:hypothetical protein